MLSFNFGFNKENTMRLHSRVTFLSAEWEILEIHDNGVLLKSLNRNIDDRFVKSGDVKHFRAVKPDVRGTQERYY